MRRTFLFKSVNGDYYVVTYNFVAAVRFDEVAEAHITDTRGVSNIGLVEIQKLNVPQKYWDAMQEAAEADAAKFQAELNAAVQERHANNWR